MEDAALELAPADALTALLRANVLSLHPNGAYSARVRHVETFLARAAPPPAPALGTGDGAAALPTPR